MRRWGSTCGWCERAACFA